MQRPGIWPGLLFIAFSLSVMPFARQVKADGKPYVSPMTILYVRDIFHVHEDGTYSEKQSFKLRINDDSAVKQYGQTLLVFTQGRERMKVLSAATLTPDGKRIQVPSGEIYTQPLPVSSKAPMFGDIKIKRIVFPDVQVGSVLTYRYRNLVSEPLFEGQFTLFDSLLKTVAFKKAHIELIAPADMKLHIETRGAMHGGKVAAKAGTQHWLWTAHNLKAIPHEHGSVSPAQVSPFVAVSTFSDYKAVARAYGVKAAKAAAVTHKVRKLADRVTQGISNPRQQAEALYNWVSKHIRYVAVYFGRGGVVPHKADEIIDKGYGDCKDHATLLQALLAAKGIQSSQVLVNAKHFYTLTKTALSTDIFDHCINYLPKYHLFVDATLGQAPFGTLSPSEYGKPALVVDAGNGEPAVMQIPNATPGQDQAHSVTTATLHANGDVTGTVSYKDTGLFQFLDRRLLSRLPNGVQAQVAGRLISAVGVQGSGDLKYNDPDDLAKPLRFKGSFSLPGYVDYPGDGTFQLPVGIPDTMGLSLRLAQAISLPSRSMPFSCPANRTTQTIHLTVPKGFEGQLPKPVKFNNALGSYHSSYQRQGRVISVNRVLTLDSKHSTCSGHQYGEMKVLYSHAIKDLRRQILYQATHAAVSPTE